MISKNESIVTAFAEYVNGPGWVNCPIWVIVRGVDHKLREECIQPEYQTAEMRSLFQVSNAAHLAMTKAARLWASNACSD